MKHMNTEAMRLWKLTTDGTDATEPARAKGNKCQLPKRKEKCDKLS